MIMVMMVIDNDYGDYVVMFGDDYGDDVVPFLL